MIVKSLHALKKISQEHPTTCVRAGALMAVLSYLDFFSTRRVALSTAASVCKKLLSDAADFVMEAVPYRQIFYHDMKARGFEDFDRQAVNIDLTMWSFAQSVHIDLTTWSFSQAEEKTKQTKIIVNADESVTLNDDVLGLIVFKSSISDPSSSLYSWSEDDETPCSWKFITCNPATSVTGLSLDGLNLSGKIGRGLEKLQSLKDSDIGSFSLVGNQFSGALPSDIDLPYLLVLITGTSQSRQHDKSESVRSHKSPTAVLFDVDTGRISIRHREMLKSTTLNVLERS
ncbi:probably inactive leucine-rich repeat receptor-like protein kinase [Tanacetum coccineum]